MCLVPAGASPEAMPLSKLAMVIHFFPSVEISRMPEARMSFLLLPFFPPVKAVMVPWVGSVSVTVKWSPLRAWRVDQKAEFFGCR